ncbi:hypothetical protein [Eupransor demetentiae]|uniref:HrgC protein n=1 Tax=Eupransor demetentiae TaxID=3109584 RepID=A0ABM9N2V5_9LACO|nr:hypothetical protein R54876_GBNLAHCA_00027 [Lactobacillaceae bacterium LMG 33000]
MRQYVQLVQQDTGERVTTITGFSWTSLFWDAWPMLFRGDYAMFFGFFILGNIASLITLGAAGTLLHIYLGSQYNTMHIKQLLKKGYVPINEETNQKLERLGLDYNQYHADYMAKYSQRYR